MEPVYPTQIAITNARCIESLTLNLSPQPGEGQLIEIVADNAQGKTTFQEALEALLYEGKDPSLIRHGAEKAEFSMLLTDGNVITRVLTPTEAKLTISGPTGRVPAPATFLKAITPGFSSSPLAFDEGDAKARLSSVLALTSHVQLDPQAVVCLVGESIVNLLGPSFPRNTVDLVGLRRLITAIVDRRGAIGTSIKEKESVLAAQAASIIETEETSPSAQHKLAQLEILIREKRAAEETSLASIRTTANLKRQQIRFKFSGEEADLRAEFEKAISDLRSRQQTEIEAIDQREIDKITTAKTATAAALTELEKEAHALQMDVQAYAKQSGLRDLRDRLNADIVSLTTHWASLDKARQDLETECRRIAEEALLPGMSINANSEIMVDNIPWDALNSASRILHAVRLYARGNPLRLMSADGGERLGPERRQELESVVKREGVVFLLFSVASAEWIREHGPGLAVRTRNAHLTVTKASA